MALPKLDRNMELVKLRDKDPKEWSWRKLAAKYGFVSHNTAKQIYNTFSPKFKKLRTYPQKRS
jgi:hypothetical protein